MRNLSNIDPPQMSCDLIKSPPLFLRTAGTSNGFSPYNSIDIVLLRFVSEPVALRVQGSHFFALNEVQRVDPRCTVSVCPHGINIA